ncbi:hypothetical protein ACHHYP_06136 [Achlya hypogyna]|uniref:Transmembrane protein n=1 Tax=Achlya hypogyna TaxID=1202772 RepID=A0A1V9YVU7_ACHHY|nr:hypothetical protein ACHHYP_06136 [Achlya hypogyna]
MLSASLLRAAVLRRPVLAARPLIQLQGLATDARKTSTGRLKLLGNNDELPKSMAVPSDVLYEFHRKTYFTTISSASLLQIAFWSWFKGAEMAIPIAPVEVPDTTLMAIITNDAWSSIGLGASVMMAGVVGFFAQRSVARVSVIAGGAKLRITTHKFLGGLSEPMDFALPQVRVQSQTDKYITLKIGDAKGFYLIDVNGTFHNRAKLEHILKVAPTTAPQPSDKNKPSAAFPLRSDLPRTEWKAKK